MKLLQNALIVIVMLLGIASQVEAQAQRMAIGAGTFTVGGGTGGMGGTPVDAYCLDIHRSVPHGKMISVLGPGAPAAQVTRLSDNTTLPLTVAIQKGWISFHGQGSAEGLLAVSEDGNEYRVSIEKPIALSEESNDFSEDILATLAWMSSPVAPADLSANVLWEHREAEAFKMLGEDAVYAEYFQKGPVAFWELRLRVDRADGKMIVLAHKNSGADAYDRIVLSAHSPVRIFSGANADREIVRAKKKKGNHLEIQIANLEGLEHMEPFFKHIENTYLENVEKFKTAEPGSKERRSAIEQVAILTQNYRDVSFTAAALGLLLTVSEQEELSVTETPELATAAGGGGKLIAYNGVNIGFAGGEPPINGGSSSPSNPPNAVLALIKVKDKSEKESAAHAHVPQGKHWWTITGHSQGAPKIRLDSVFASGLAALMSAVRRDANPDDVVSDVKSSIEFNRQAYEGLIPVGTIQMRLLLDLNEKFDIRVAVIVTPAGIKLIALNERVQTK